MELFLFVVELVGTVAFAISGAMTGIRKGMDIFGVCTLGITAATGGGIIRDLILGATPPAAFRDPVYLLVAAGVSVLFFVPWIRPRLHGKGYDWFLLISDSVGLGVFTVMGICSAYRQDARLSFVLLLFVGTVTGVGGGVLRDIFAGNTPYIFVKHVYAVASLLGGAVCAVILRTLGEAPAIAAGMLVVIVIRILAAVFGWNLPVARGEGEPSDVRR